MSIRKWWQLLIRRFLLWRLREISDEETQIMLAVEEMLALAKERNTDLAQKRIKVIAKLVQFRG